jgi:hypothetical protein
MEYVAGIRAGLKDSQEQADWYRLAVEQFLAGYTESDAIYDGNQETG